MFVAASQEKTHNFQCPECLEVSQWYSHMGATHSNGGKCTVCSYVYQDHSREKYGYVSSKTSTHHIITYDCSFDGCSSKTTQEVKHRGASHSNGGKCTETGCGYQYQAHAKAATPTSYDKTETQHTPVYNCTYSGCTSTYTGTAENHKGGTHENGGKCTVCNYQYEQHSQTETLVDYKKTETTHTPKYACSVSGCTATYNGTEIEHSGATHENEGKCTICDYQYEQHTKTNTVVEYEKTETTHTPKYACSATGCVATYDGTIEEHTGGTHENEGKCTVCDYQYEQHTRTNTVAKYGEITGTTHTVEYTCSAPGCLETFSGVTEEHSGANHENEGKCTICDYQYEHIDKQL